MKLFFLSFHFLILSVEDGKKNETMLIAPSRPDHVVSLAKPLTCTSSRKSTLSNLKQDTKQLAPQQGGQSLHDTAHVCVRKDEWKVEKP